MHFKKMKIFDKCIKSSWTNTFDLGICHLLAGMLYFTTLRHFNDFYCQFTNMTIEVFFHTISNILTIFCHHKVPTGLLYTKHPQKQAIYLCFIPYSDRHFY